jgi:Superfamily II DNA/RNA helicases, SNF2 family
VVVSAVSPQLLNLLSKRFVQLNIPHGMIIGDKTEVERQIAMDDFQSGRTKWILINQAGGTGITLTAAKYLVRLERPWSLVDDLQINDRVHRIGSEIHDSIIIVDYVTVGTVQEHVKEVLDGKGLNFEDIVQDKAQLLRMLQDEKAGK